MLKRKWLRDSHTGPPLEKEERYIMATLDDLHYIMGLWLEVAETTFTGLPRHILGFYHRVIEKEGGKLTYQELAAKYNKISDRRRSSNTIYRWVKLLKEIGWMDTERDPEAKNRDLAFSIKNPENYGDIKIPSLEEAFTLDSLKNFFNTYLLNFAKEDVIRTYRNFAEDEPASLETIYETYYTSPNAKFKSLESKPEEEPKEEEKPKEHGDLEIPRSAKSFGELEDILRIEFEGGGTQQLFEELAVKYYPSLTREQAARFFESLVDEGKILMDPEGRWVWLK